MSAASTSTQATAPAPASGKRYSSFREFYPYYRSQHQRLPTRVMHVLGTTGALATAAACAATKKPQFLPLAIVIGYGFAFAGHLFEHNKPATFKYPIWSFMADFRMWWSILTGKEPWGLKP